MSVEPWRRNQHMIVAAVFVVFLGFAFVLPFLTLYVRELGIADADAAASWAGVLLGIAPLLAGALSPLWGRWADRYGHKRVALRALAGYVALMALSAAVANVWQLLALRIGIGLFGSLGPLGLAMATSLAPRDQMGRAVGMVQSAQILAAAGGPLAGGLLADALGIRLTFLLTAAFCAAALAMVALGYRETGRPAGRSGGKGSLAEVLRLPQVAPLLVVLFLVNFIGRSFVPVLPLHLQLLGVGEERLAFSTGLLISVYSIAAALSASWLGRASRARSPRALLLASLLAGAVTVLPMALLSSLRDFLWLAVLLGAASGGCLTLCYTIGGLLVPAERRATAFGFFSAAALFGGAVSPICAGFLAHWRLRGVYYVDAALFLLLAAGLLLGTRPLPPAASRGAAP